jgi:hypothetical protein
MKKKVTSSKKPRFPKGWDERKVRSVINYYENQTDAAAAAEDDARAADRGHTFMQIPVKLVPAVRRLLRKKAS